MGVLLPLPIHRVEVTEMPLKKKITRALTFENVWQVKNLAPNLNLAVLVERQHQATNSQMSSIL